MNEASLYYWTHDILTYITFHRPGIIYIFGGQTRRGLNLSTWEEFDTSTSSWVPTPTYAEAVATPRFVSLVSNIPSEHQSMNNALRTIEQVEYDNKRMLDQQIRGSIGFVFGQSIFIPPLRFQW